MTVTEMEREMLIEEAIDRLKEADIDGEMMHYILNQTYLEEQMLKQLVLQFPTSTVIDLLEEKISLEKAK